MKYCCTNDQREGSCYYEFQKGRFAEEFWLGTSLCLSDDTFTELGLYDFFTKVVPNFACYGITEISLPQWQRLKQEAEKYGGAIKDVVAEIDAWAGSTEDKDGIITVLGI